MGTISSFHNWVPVTGALSANDFNGTEVDEGGGVWNDTRKKPKSTKELMAALTRQPELNPKQTVLEMFQTLSVDATVEVMVDDTAETFDMFTAFEQEVS